MDPSALASTQGTCASHSLSLSLTYSLSHTLSDLHAAGVREQKDALRFLLKLAAPRTFGTQKSALIGQLSTACMWCSRMVYSRRPLPQSGSVPVLHLRMKGLAT